MAAPHPAPYAEPAPQVIAPDGRGSGVAPSPGPSTGASTGESTGLDQHEAIVVERGAFARAVCTTCDWRGPARRARAFATADIDEHRLLGGAPLTVDLRDRD